MKNALKIFLVIFTLLLVGFLLFYFRIIWFVYPDRTIHPLRGIDVSHHQGDIDWNKVARDDVAFVFIKATEADDYFDAHFTENEERAHAAGLKVGAYHYYSYKYNGETQAQNFITNVATSSIDFPPVVDLEFKGNSTTRPSKENFQKELATYIDLIRKQYGTEPTLYTTYEFYDTYLYPEYKDSHIWIRDIYSNPRKDMNWTIWQYNPRGRVAGIDGPVDLNVLK